MAQRIASLLASSTEILYGLGLGDRVVAVSHECDSPAEALTKPRVTRTHVAAEASSLSIDRQVRELMAQGAALYEIDTAALVDLAPDLIVTQAQCDVCAVRYAEVLETVARFPALSETRIVSLNPTSLTAVLDDIRRVAEAAECPSAAERWVAALETRIDAVRRRTDALPDEQRPRVACIEWIEPLMLAGNWMPELIELAGGRQSVTVGGEHSPYIAWPQLVAFDPQVIVIMPCGFDLPRTVRESPRLLEHPAWSDLTAVREGRVYAVDGNAFFNRSGPRLVDSLELLAFLVHCGDFAEPPFSVRKRPWQRLGV